MGESKVIVITGEPEEVKEAVKRILMAMQMFDVSVQVSANMSIQSAPKQKERA